MGEDAIHENTSKRLKQSFDYFYHDQDRDSKKFRHHRLGPGFFTTQPGQTLSQDVAQLRDKLAKHSQASNP